jgi:hypothetical protein
VGLVLLVGVVSVGCLALVVARSNGGPLAALFATLAVGVVMALAARVDIAATTRVLGGLRVFLPIVAFVFITTWIGTAAGTLQFDEIGAQVIAVLLLALAVDARFFWLRTDWDRLDVIGTCLIMVILAAGEYYALKGLFIEEPRHGEMVAGAIAAGFIGVAITALAGPWQRPGDEPSSRR